MPTGPQVASYFAVFSAGVVAASAVFFVSQPVQGARDAEQAASVPQQISQAPANSDQDSAASGESTNTESKKTENNRSNQAVGPKSVASANAVPIGELRRGSMVLVEGVVDRVTDEDEFVISDASGSIPVWTGQTFFTVQPGERVSVRGFVDDDLYLEIYAQEIIKQDGTVIEISARSW